MEQFVKILEQFCLEDDCKFEIIDNNKYRGRLLKVENGDKTVLHRIEHIFAFDCTDSEMRQALEAVKTLF